MFYFGTDYEIQPDPVWKIEYQDVNKQLLEENKFLKEQNEEMRIFLQEVIDKYEEK